MVCVNHTKRGWFNQDSKIPAGAEIQTVSFWPRSLSLKPLLPNWIWPFSWLHIVGPNSSGQYTGGPLFRDHQEAVWNIVFFSEPASHGRDFMPIFFAGMLSQRSPTLVFVSSLRNDFCLLNIASKLAEVGPTSYPRFNDVFTTFWPTRLFPDILIVVGWSPSEVSVYRDLLQSHFYKMTRHLKSWFIRSIEIIFVPTSFA